MLQVDTLISAPYIIPVIPKGKILHEHSIVVSKNLITDILPTSKAKKKYSCINSFDSKDHVVIPGLINAHTHAAMSLLRGFASDMPLEKWLNEHIWPAEKKWVSEEFVRDGVELAIGEMLRSGVTCFNDMYFFPEVTAHVASKIGIRACVGMIVMEFPSSYAKNSDEYIAKGLNMYDEYKNQGLITPIFAPHAPYTVSDTSLEKITSIAQELELPIHIHLHETENEIKESLEKYSCRPFERLTRIGLVSPQLICVHMTQLTQQEIEEVAEKKVKIIHCPESNMKLASGICPVADLAAKKVNIALGTDSPASNDDHDMLSEMKTAALLSKISSKNPEAATSTEVIEMATINGAKALGLEKAIGSIEINKSADFAAIKLSEIETLPCYDIASQIVHSATRSQVTDVWIAGEKMLSDRKLLHLDELSLKEIAQKWKKKIKKD
ncbi:MAG: TRZ/ATZ family hydrolase [Pseudomonadota bacterium]